MQESFLDKQGQHPRELNPFWRDGGSGLPSTAENRSNRSAESGDGDRGGPGSPSSSSDRRRQGRKMMGDGGHSWLLRAYKRVLEQSSESGRSVEEIASERWGSVEKLHSLLRAAGIDPESPDALPRGRGRRDYLYSRTRRLEEGRKRRSMEEFDERLERRRGGGREGYSSRSGGGGGGGRSEPERRRERGEGEDERSAEREGEHRKREGDLERRKRELKDRFRKPQTQKSSDSSSEFLKPGDLDQGRHSFSTGIRGGVGATSSGHGWRKKGAVSETDKVIDHETVDKPTDSVEPSQSRDTLLEQSSLSAPQEDSTVGREMVEGAGVCVVSPQEEEERVTEAQLNSLGAKLMKAELTGNSGEIEKLKCELDRLREVKKGQDTSASQQTPDASTAKTGAKREERMLVLTKTDRFGREKPVQLPSTSSQGYRPPHTTRAPTHTKKGKRERYFQDDDRYSLRELVEQERMMTAEETHAAIARMASKFVPAAGSDETVDDLVDSKSATKLDEGKELERAKKRSVLESRKMADAVERCQLCFDGQNFNKHLLVAVGMNAYLCAPWHTSLSEGHCFIVPMEHAMCSLYLDENVWSEIEVFRKGLTRMFADRDLDIVFMETYTSVKRKSHMYIDCIPLPREEGGLAPMYFKKAILESDEEWAQNKKLVDTKEKGVRGSLPTGLPYFFAEFGMDGGFGHVIEDTDLFPHYFGREVVGGLLDLDPRLWLKPRREEFDKQKAKVVKLSEWWAPYDWTQKLQQT